MSEPVPNKWSRGIVALMIAALAALFGLIHALQSGTSGSQPDWRNAITWGMTFSFLLIPVGYGAWMLARRFPIGPTYGVRNVIIHTAAGITLGALHPYALIWVFSFISSPRWFVAVADSVFPYLHFWFWQDLLLVSLVYAMSLFAAQSMRYYRGYHEGSLRAARLEAALATSNLGALKMQLHPHFLFNALHSISALQVTDSAAAQRMTTLLGDFLRMTLREFDEQKVPLRREVEFLECYLAIEKMRFGERLRFSFEVPDALSQVLVPHLILQPLVENAVRHAIAPFNTGGSILVRASRRGEQLALEVQDSGPGIANVLLQREGVGLRNTRARLAQLYGTAHSFELTSGASSGLKAELLLPYETA